MTSLTRRVALKVIGFGSTLLGLDRIVQAQKLVTNEPQPPIDQWAHTADRVWLGGQFWANPMEDWKVVEGAAECQSFGGNRNIHLITHEFTETNQPFAMSVDVELAEKKGLDGGVGFRMGIRSDINEYRSNCFASGGVNIGISKGKLQIGGAVKDLPEDFQQEKFSLQVQGTPNVKGYRVTLNLLSDTGEQIETVSTQMPGTAFPGNIALVNNYNVANRRNPNRDIGKTRYRFRNWVVSGESFTVRPEREFGPLLWTMYSLSDSRSDEGFVLKLSALTGPLGKDDNQTVQLQIRKNGEWSTLGEAPLDTDAWVATFRIPNWDEKQETPYRVLYKEKRKGEAAVSSEWSGLIKANPTGRPLRFGALTCQNDYAFPYEPVANNVVKLDPDMLYFSGDQIYESHGGYGIIREPADPAILNYLRKFYQFGWSFREAMKDRPTLCIPDDHDVFQGNIWGEGGTKMKGIDQGASSKGGYREPAKMVNVVHTTCVSHHPDFYDPAPSKQDISVYFGDVVYGDVSFAVIADRQWKSGPEHVDTASGRADHVPDKDFDTSVLDKPGLVLLGERQEEFLKAWCEDWRGHSMKVVLSQTVFAGVATHHGNYDGYLKADLDSGGWPQTARNRAIDIIRKSNALHINGDQHLTTLCQYGVHKQRDSNWSFCPPAIGVGYPRWWRPDEIGMPHENRPKHGLADTGEFIDGLGNKVYVYAVGNPEVATEKNRYDRAEQKGSGFGLVTIDTAKKTFHIESFRFLIDVTDGKPSNQFPGWPVTIHQSENSGENKLS
ncbi:alkaline phosphatase D family protein [Thalassoglobus sp.]|uniref:alkaline phosphatase D family protein n=1 Tax=Thalassoglobus sp. TaxID=2795869 RepID=UPI003AA86D25